MITKNRVIAERLLREFIRGSFGIISEGFIPSKEQPDKVDELMASRAAHLKEAKDFVNLHIDDLVEIIDDIEGPITFPGTLDNLEKILKSAMAIDDKYNVSDETGPNVATVFTCYAIAEGNVHDIPFFLGSLYDKLYKKKSRTSSVSQQLGELKEARTPAAVLEKAAATIVDNEITKLIPAILKNDERLAIKIANDSASYKLDASAKYGKVIIDPTGRMTSLGGNLSFNDALKKSMLDGLVLDIERNTVPFKEIDQFISGKNSEVAGLDKKISDKQGEINELFNEEGQFLGNEDDVASLEILKDDLDTLNRDKSRIEDVVKKSEFLKQEITRQIDMKLENKDFIIQKIRDFGAKSLVGPERIAFQYPRTAKVGKEVAAYLGTKTGIGIGLISLLYGSYEATTNQIMKIEGEYQTFQEDAIESIAQTFENNDRSSFADTLRKYKRP